MDNEEKWICHPLNIEKLEERPMKETNVRSIVKKINEMIENLNLIMRHYLELEDEKGELNEN